MVSLASLASFTVTNSGSNCFDGSLLVSWRISVRKGEFGRSINNERLHYRSLCRCTIATELVAEMGNSVSPTSTFRGSKDEDDELVLKPSPKPVLKERARVDPIITLNPRNTTTWTPKKLVRDTETESLEIGVDRDKVIESLGEVLEKVEKLERTDANKSNPKESSFDSTSVANNNSKIKDIKSVNPIPTHKSKTLKSVWKKGNPTASIQKVIKEMPKTDKVVEAGDSTKAQQVKPDIPAAAAPLRPQAPSKFQPKLQSRPSIATPPIKKPVILKDIGAGLRTPVSDDMEMTPKRERKPILVDKFAPRKPVVDPLLAQAVIPPPKPVKASLKVKTKDERRKKVGTAGGLRRRLDDDSDILELDAEISNSSPVSTTARKGRKWTKASRKAARLQAAKASAPVKVDILEVGDEGILIEDLAYSLAVSEADILGYLFSKGINSDSAFKLDKDMTKMVCKEYDVEVIEISPVKVETLAKKKEVLDEEDLDMLEGRPPVLTIMGHVDHGKTTLLDYIRKSKVAASEAGGITQGIGAYKVLVPMDGKLQPCVFLDTPGHEAFGAMRARGARVTDIAIIVVAADDGVRPQTNEAIAHAKAAEVPIVIAINKVDKDGANSERVKQELSSVGLMPEEWGGDTPMVEISALKGENVDDLLETVMLVAELQELKANPHRKAKGTVLEASLHKSKGPVATFIVQNGTLKQGDVVFCGEAFGKVRALFDDSGNRVNNAGPSTAVQVIGLNNVPIAGDEFEVVESLDMAREKAEVCAEALRESRISAKAGDGKVTLSAIASSVSQGKYSGLDMHQLNIIMKVDVQGSIEAIRQALQVLPQDNVTLKFLLHAPGDISTSDIDLAVASKAVIFGFNVRASSSVKNYADNKGIEIRLYKIIYELIDDMRNAMEGLLEPVEEQVPIGVADVRAVFSSGSGHVAGCMITQGKVVKGCGIRVVRNGKSIYSGVLDSLRRVKEMVKEVNAGLECGIGVEDFSDWEAGDVIEAFTAEQKRRTLEEASASVTAALEGAGVER